MRGRVEIPTTRLENKRRQAAVEVLATRNSAQVLPPSGGRSVRSPGNPQRQNARQMALHIAAGGGVLCPRGAITYTMLSNLIDCPFWLELAQSLLSTVRCRRWQLYLGMPDTYPCRAARLSRWSWGTNKNSLRVEAACVCPVLSGVSAHKRRTLLFLAFRYASPPYRSQRLDFAWPFDVPVACPIRGQSSTDLDDRWPFMTRYHLRGCFIYPACQAARTWVLARSLGTHRFVAPAAAPPLELTPPLLPVGFGPGSLGLWCFAVWCCDG